MAANHRTLIALVTCVIAPLALGSSCPAPQSALPTASDDAPTLADVAGSAEPLLRPLDPSADVRRSWPEDARALRSRFVALELENLRDASTGEGREAVALDLFPDVALVAARERWEVRSEDGYSWFGRIAGDEPDGRVVLTVVDGDLAGLVLHAGSLYRIRGKADGPYEVTEVDASRFPPEHGAETAVPVRRAAALALEGATEPEATRVTDGNTTEMEPQPSGGFDREGDGSAIFQIYKFLLPRVVDVGMVYTWAAKFAVPSIQAEIQLAVDLTNQALMDSGALLQLNLTATAVVSYTESGNLQTDLQRLQGTSDGYLDFIHATRDLWNWRADIVGLVVGDGNACGRGYQLEDMESDPDADDWAFHVVVVGCMVDNLSFAHEAGHNMGAGHDWYVDSDPGQNHGYILHAKKRRTIMAYYDECTSLGYDCPRILGYSTPHRVFQGAPTGIAAGQPWEADNTREINENRHYLADFR